MECHYVERTRLRSRPALVSRPPQLGALDISKVIEDIEQSELPEHGCES